MTILLALLAIPIALCLIAVMFGAHPIERCDVHPRHLRGAGRLA